MLALVFSQSQLVFDSIMKTPCSVDIAPHPNNLQQLHVFFARLFAVSPLLSLKSRASVAQVISIVKFIRMEFTMEITAAEVL
jgi:hypothetical protein